MPLPKNRSTKYRQRVRKTSRGSKTVYLKPKNVGTPRCAVCKSVLSGISAKGSRTQKSVSRIYGGRLCHSCTAKVVVNVARINDKAKSMDDVEIVLRPYVAAMLQKKAKAK
jgi:ribosomal protein L34E